MLRNPHIVRVYEMLEFDGGWMGLVMDHIDGQTIEHLVEHHGPLDVVRALRLARQFANGLSEAHDAGMIHRDIKPANLMVEPMPDGEDFAFILDFGVVRLDDEARMTTGFLGTPLFASPEQALMGELDARSDIYSLGATLFYMLTGRAPFESRDSIEALEAHIKQAAPTLAQARPDLRFPRRIEKLLADTLKKAPADRPQSLIEFIQVIESILESPSNPVLDEESGSGDNEFMRTDSSTRIRELGAESTHVGRPTSGQFDRANHDLGRDVGSGTIQGHLHIQDESDGDGHTDATQDGPGANLDEAQFGIEETNPEGFQRPDTAPEGLESARSLVASETIQIMPNASPPVAGLESDHGKTVEAADVSEKLRAQDEPASDETVGVPFARSVRLSSGRHDHSVAVADDQNEVWLIQKNDAKPMLAPAVLVSSLALSDSSIILGQQDGTIGRYDFDSEDFQALYQDVRRATVSAVASSAAGDLVVAGSVSGRVYLFRPDEPDFGWKRLGSGVPVRCVAVAPDASMFCVVRADGSVTVSHGENPRGELTTLQLTDEPIDVTFSRDGHLLAVAYETGEMSIIEVLSGRQLSALPYDCNLPQSLYFSDSNSLYGFESSDGLLQRWNMTLSRPVQFEKTPAR